MKKRPLLVLGLFFIAWKFLFHFLKFNIESQNAISRNVRRSSLRAVSHTGWYIHRYFLSFLHQWKHSIPSFDYIASTYIKGKRAYMVKFWIHIRVKNSAVQQ